MLTQTWIKTKENKMAQPSTDSVSRAYELLANTHANNAKATMEFGNAIANNLNDFGKNVVAYGEKQKDNAFREKMHSDDVKIKKRALANDESRTQEQNALTYQQAEAQKFANLAPKTLYEAWHTRDKNGNLVTDPNILKTTKGVITSENFITGAISGYPIQGSPLR